MVNEIGIAADAEPEQPQNRTFPGRRNSKEDCQGRLTTLAGPDVRAGMRQNEVSLIEPGRFIDSSSANALPKSDA